MPFPVRPKAPDSWHADWNMAELACWTLARMCEKAVELSVRVEMRDNDVLEMYSALLHAIYREVKPLVNSTWQKGYEEDFATVRRMLNDWLTLKARGLETPFQQQIGDLLLNLHERLLVTIQFSGLKWPFSRKHEETLEEKGKRMLGG